MKHTTTATNTRINTHRRSFTLARSSTPASTTVGEYLTGWLAARPNLRPATRLAYELHLRRYLNPHIGDIALTDLRLEDVEAMYAAIATMRDRTGMAPRPTTIRCIHATLMSALNTAVRRALIDLNPAAHVELPRVEHTRMTTWTAPQLTAFLDTASSDGLFPVFLLMALTGMRRGEAVGLRWCDVDLTEGTLMVEQQIVAVASTRHTGPPKSAHGHRTLHLPHTLVDELEAHHVRQHAARVLAGPVWVDTGLVFTTMTGEALNPAFVSRRFDHLVIASGVPRIRLHGLRHTSASLGLASGESLFEVSRRLGHSSITITADVYSHVTPTTARQSAERLNALIGGTSTTRHSH